MEKMNLSQLVVEANKSDYCLNASREVFRRKYCATIFSIRGPFTSEQTYSISEDGNRASVLIRSEEMFERIFTPFSDLIQYIKLHFEFISAAVGRKMVETINRNCVESLKMFALEDCKENVLDDLNSTFPEVIDSKFSTLSSHPLVIREDAPSLSQLFPKLNQLLIEYTRAADWSIIGDEFPNLKCIHVNLPKMAVAELPNETFVLNLTRNSPELVHFSVKHTTLSLLNEIHDTLPKLDCLELHYLANNYSNSNGDPILFDNVVTLIVYEDKSVERIPEKIHFPQIKQLTLNLQPEFTDTWLDFIKEQLNQTINTFNLTVGILTNEHLLTIPVILPHLQNVIIRCGTDFTANEIMTFLGRCEYLLKAEFVIQMEKLELDALRSKLLGKWKYGIHPAKRRVKINLQR